MLALVKKNWAGRTFLKMSHDFPKNVIWLSQQCSRPLVSIKVANGSIVEHIGNGDRLQCQRLCQNLGVEGLSKKCPMTFPKMFQASNIYKSCKRRTRTAYWNYSGSARVGPVQSGPIVIIRLSQFNCNCNCLLELSLAIRCCMKYVEPVKI